MKKIYVVLLVVVILIIGLYVLITRPSEEEETYHRAAVCYIIQHHDIRADNEVNFGRVKNILDYSVPDYAYYKPKVYPDLIHQVIQNYLSLSNQQKITAKNDANLCNALLKNKS